MAEFPTDPTALSSSTPNPAINQTNPAGSPIPDSSQTPSSGLGSQLDSNSPTSATPQPPNPIPPPPPTQNEDQSGSPQGAVTPPNPEPPNTPIEPESLPEQVPNPNDIGTGGGSIPHPESPPDQSSMGTSFPSQTPIEPSIPEPITPTPQPSMISSEEVGPPWMRTDPSVRAAQDASGGMAGSDLTPGSPQTVEVSPSWQQAEQKIDVSTGDEPQEGHFPVIIFVILVLGILVAIGVFLFTQGALPF